MKNLLKHILASISGTLALFLLLKVEDLLDVIGVTERSEFQYPPHVTISDLFLTTIFFIGILIIQLAVVNPFISYLKKFERCTKNNILILGILLSLVIGLSFGLILGSTELGISDILITISVGIGIFGLQYTVNFSTYFGLEKLIK
jgi:hypothetical protein